MTKAKEKKCTGINDLDVVLGYYGSNNNKQICDYSLTQSKSFSFISWSE